MAEQRTQDRSTARTAAGKTTRTAAGTTTGATHGPAGTERLVPFGPSAAGDRAGRVPTPDSGRTGDASTPDSRAVDGTAPSGGAGQAGSPGIERVDLGEVPYPEALTAMAEWVARRRAGETPDRLTLLTHPPVITYGSRTPRAELPVDSPIPMVPVDRGGQATYHGPGQLVGYLVLNLRERGPADIVRWLEDGLIEACASLGFETVRRDTPKGAQSLVGLWTPRGEKVASIGMRIRGGITSHGFALNVTSDLAEFAKFTACGLPDVAMTSLAELAAAQGRPVPSDRAVRDAVAAALGAA
ncbi:lipoyl(octanoyl) transferase LipB [Streptomyces sp. TS71-3]|uniref:lipoyl(octanoyl) transferase LipB n=1 Tax=Streptomyces sp. TS71-3 TaxID=2733862 RepID=UPI001B250051|nr:lipoyl(octanoyl) transferase LipB [Streptomyces sp. TS71-3]GHJ38384.1 hypothetical protein Sm713_39930 [Streptomyces sp. TS71-3]